MLEEIKKELKQLEISIARIREYINIEHDKQIEDLFKRLNSPLESLFKSLDDEIRLIDFEKVSFRITENSLTYQVNDQNFVAVYPQVNALKVEYAVPDGWRSFHLTEDDKEDGKLLVRDCVPFYIKDSYIFIKEKKK